MSRGNLSVPEERTKPQIYTAGATRPFGGESKSSGRTRTNQRTHRKGQLLFVSFHLLPELVIFQEKPEIWALIEGLPSFKC